VETEKSLWPLTAGSTWTYRITEVGLPPFDKVVKVLGVETVPDSTVQAAAVLSEQPHLTEKSWQVERDGLAFRVREEDRRQGFLVRRSTWDPANVKSLAAVPQDTSWTHEARVLETTFFAADSSTEQKERTYVWTVLGMGETVTVPAGTFSNAIRVQRQRFNAEGLEKDVRTYWLVPGVGKVREEGERTEELLQYDVRPPE